MNLEGPVTLRSMTHGNRTVVVLGEFHFSLAHATADQLCPRDGITPTLTVVDYLDVLFSLSPGRKFDLFAEISPPAMWAEIDKTLLDVRALSRAPLTLFQIHYRACIDRLRTCPFPDVRFHYTDWRPEQGYVYTILTNHLFSQAGAPETAFELLLNDVTPAAFRAKMLAERPLQKQLAKTHGSAAAVIVADLDALTAVAQRSMDYLLQNLESEEAAEHYVGTIRDMWVAVVDYYLLARMFKPETSDNVIVYVGDAHREHIQLLLDRLGYTLQVSIGERLPPKYCIRLDKQPGFFFAPLAAHPPPTRGYAELVFFLSRPTFSFETSWYASEFSIIRIMALYFFKQTNASYAYRRMRISSGTYFTFQKARNALALFVHSADPAPAAPAVADALLLPTKRQIKLEDTSVRALFIYRDAYVRLSPLALVMLDFLAGNTAPAPDSNLLALLELKNP